MLLSRRAASPAPSDTAVALSDDEFADAMAALGPFETAPMPAVAVSGGADSMALCLLAEHWARARGGRVVALSVDHGLREASAAEARQVGHRLRALGIEHEIVRWRGDKPVSGIPARARAARYRLLAERCLARGLLHLLVGHHRGDQGETVLLRAERGSGADGLAAMAAVVETGAVRVVRPLLGVAPARLRAYLAARRQPWIDDPTNAELKYTRNRIRLSLADPAARDRSPADPAETATAMAVRRDARAQVVATLLARCCGVHACGFATLDAAVLLAAPPWAAAAALGRIVATFGGGERPPAADKLERLRRRLSVGGTICGGLGRCRLWWRNRAGGILAICREARGLPCALDLDAATTLLWDGRYLVEVAGEALSARSGARLGPLGEDGWREALAHDPGLRQGRIPWQAAVTMPALRDGAGLLAVPSLGVRRARAQLDGALAMAVSFRPRRSLSGTGYFLA